jgi:hypothetical protein
MFSLRLRPTIWNFYTFDTELEKNIDASRSGKKISPIAKKYSLKKAKSVEKLGGGGGTRYILEAETD